MADVRPASIDPFDLREWFHASAARLLLLPARPLVERVVGLTALRALYQDLQADGRNFPETALERLGIRWEVQGEAAAIPASGPLVAVANHPFGAADGLVLLALLRRVRPDVRLLANRLLARIPELAAHCIFVDAFGNRGFTPANARALREARRFLDSGGTLAAFPAGEVSSTLREDGCTTDGPWSPVLARLVRSTGADVVPVHFSGCNSPTFHAVGRIHPRLRTALLARELLRQRGRTIRCRLGPRLEAERLARFDEPDRLASYLRIRTCSLGDGHAVAPVSARNATQVPEPIIAASTPEVMAVEIDTLAPERALVRSGALAVYIATAREIPAALQEIGRLREIAFRACGEGSGRPLDLDRFDRHYHHLFVWNHETREVVGAYRLGATDEILPALGPGGLYTNTLFRYDPRLLAQLRPALELGRAFVRTEQQRDYAPLLLLWKGIATFVARNPRYRMLFGPVSISADYQSLSRQILARFLHATSYDADRGGLVTPRNPPAFIPRRPAAPAIAGHVVRSLAEVSTLLSEIEADQKGVPVLVRQYLKLNARLLGFNVDPDFGNALDGLMLVDLLQVEHSLLVRYMGPELAESFLEFHGVQRRKHAS
ncbi:MAG TPA: lysophospholipid acyltransferase family protein [Vicinamibacterales bacterium]|nr:lysophospholipid acyltransferase family protein [Vicinamibacterales bacterium]